MSGFQNASVTKGMMLFLGIASLTTSILDIKPYLHLQLVPHITKYHQIWRVVLHPLAFANSTELLMAELLLYSVGVGIERSFGPRKYASFVVVSTVLSAILSTISLILLYAFGVYSIPAGPYGVLFSLLWQYHRTVPTLYNFKLFGIELSYKIFTWIMAAQLVLSYPPGSLLAAASGLLTGYLYRTDTLFLLPSFSRPRRVLRPLKSYRIPLSLHHLLARIFSPLIGTSQPPRRANRILPGQIRQATGGEMTFDRLRGLLASGGAGALPPTTTIRRAGRENAATTRGVAENETTAATAASSARSAMGEWVNDMTGRGTARAPTEEEIAILTNMFPTISRDRIVQALQLSDFNTAVAVESLLDQS